MAQFSGKVTSASSGLNWICSGKATEKIVMKLSQQLEVLLKNIMALDRRKQIGLGTALLLLFVGVLTLTSYLNKPTTASLYTNLSQQDINNMSRVLIENGIKFVVSADNGTISVSPGVVTRARMSLAEYGLPSNSKSGYELFDKVNTLGLTSFMQDITNKRAIQGELARTIQMIAGVKSARIHLVTPEKNVFRRNKGRPPTASLVIKSSGQLPSKSVVAIRHLVAAAVPGLETGNVTIVGADGTLLTSKGDEATGGVSRLVEMEQNFEQVAERKIIAALGAHLGSSNFRISVTAKLNNDKRRIDETVYDPESRVERSFQTIRESGTSENKATSQPATVTQNLPDETDSAGSGQVSQENKERREETTNYEINMKKTSQISDGYQVERLTVALVVNKSRLTELLGKNADQTAIDAKIKELEDIVRSSLSLSEERNDQVKVSFMEFLPDEIDNAEPAPSGVMTFLNTHFGTIINTAGLIIGALILALLGIRPLLAFLQRETPVSLDQPAPPLALGNENNDQDASIPAVIGDAPELGLAQTMEMDLDAAGTRDQQIKLQLEKMISQSEERAATAIKHWLKLDHQEQSKAKLGV